MPTDLPRPEGVIFDLDGTLVDSVGKRIDGWIEALGAAGLWTTARTQPAGGLRSPSGGPRTGRGRCRTPDGPDGPLGPTAPGTRRPWNPTPMEPSLTEELRPLFAGRKVALTGGRWRR